MSIAFFFALSIVGLAFAFAADDTDDADADALFLTFVFTFGVHVFIRRPLIGQLKHVTKCWLLIGRELPKTYHTPSWYAKTYHTPGWYVFIG